GAASRSAGDRSANHCFGGRKRACRHRGGGKCDDRDRSGRSDPCGGSGRALRRRRPAFVTGTERPVFIFFVTGEPSGDALGGALIAALQQRTGDNLRIAGIGGERMQEHGLVSLVPLGELAIGGIAEVLPRAPVILARVRETVAAIRELR